MMTIGVRALRPIGPKLAKFRSQSIKIRDRQMKNTHDIYVLGQQNPNRCTLTRNRDCKRGHRRMSS